MSLGVITIGPDTDYREIERRVLRAMLLDGEAYIDIGPSSGYIRGIAERAVPEPGPPAEPVKQNGRSAAYLQHDPTKKHRRTKR